MSARLLGLAIYAEAPSPAAKLVLLALVDACDDEGRRIFPSVAKLARAAQCSARQVQRVLRLYCAVGLLRIVREASGRPGQTTHYEMNTDVLRRMEASGWQAVAGTASLTDDDAETPTNGCADGLAGEGPEQERGDTMSPVSPARGVTSGTGTGDMICHPNPQEEPSRLRESAGARPEGKEGLEDGERSAGPMQPQPAQLGPAGEPASEPASEPSAGTPTLERFLKLWPTTMADSLERTASAWAALDWEQRREAVRAVPRFLDHLKALKRDRIPAGFTYLAEKRWLHMPAEAEAHRAASSFVVLNPLTKDFWAVLFDRIRQGQPVAVMLMLARDGKATQCRLGEFPTALRDSLSACPAGSERGAAWLGWLAARGHRMPDLKPEAWVFLPPDLPPGHDPAHGVGHGLGDDRGQF